MRSEEVVAEASRQAAVFLAAPLRQAGLVSFRQSPASYRQMAAVTGMQVATLPHSSPALSSEQPLLAGLMVLQGRSTTNL